MLVELNPARWLDRVVDLQVLPGFDEKFKEVIQFADPFVLYTHESQSDGAVAAVVTRRLVSLAKETKRKPRLKGFVMSAARSMIDGQQGRKLQIAYKVFNLLISANGLKVYGFTREEDEAQYGMSRGNLLTEFRPLMKKMKKGYPPSILLGGTVEAGRSDEGSDPEDIHGLQRLIGPDILTFSRRLASINNGREIAFILVGLHGGFRLQSPNRDKRYVTNEALGTLLGIPEKYIPHVQTEAKVGTIILSSQLEERFGKNWIIADKKKKDPSLLQGFNDYIMSEAALLIPSHARGVYSTSSALELTAGS